MVRPAFRAPSSQERVKRSSQNSGATRREIAKLYPHSLLMILRGCLIFESGLPRRFRSARRILILGVVPAKAGTPNAWHSR